MRWIWISLLLSACGTGRTPAPPSAPASVGIASARPHDAQPGAVPQTAKRDACPIVPLRLLIAPLPPATSSPTTFMRLGEDGVVTLGPLGLRGQLDRKGCLSLKGELTVDGSTPGEVWTPHERFVIADGRMQLAGGRSLQIEADGSIVTFDRTGHSDTSGLLRFEGYRPEATCAAHLLLAAFFASMPSMALSDGRPERLPQPPESRCDAAPSGDAEPQ